MHSSGTPGSSARAVIERLTRATNDHDIDALVACFAIGYVNETPAHPLRGFTGREQVRQNWTQIFTAVPDIVVEVTSWGEDSVSVAVEPPGSGCDVLWTEWKMGGSRRDGTAHRMAGVVIFVVAGDEITAARFYLEPVETSSGDVSDAVRAQMAGRP